MKKRNKITPIGQQLLAEIVEFCDKSGVSENNFGLMVANNNKLVKRLRNGCGIWSNNIDAVREFIANYKA